MRFGTNIRVQTLVLFEIFQMHNVFACFFSTPLWLKLHTNVHSAASDDILLIAEETLYLAIQFPDNI